MKSILCLLASVCAAVGCSSSGQLNATPLTPECAPADDACRSAAVPMPPLAVGARQSLEVVVLPDQGGGQAAATHFVSANEDVAVIDSGSILATGPGVSAILLAASDESVLDFTHIAASRAERLALKRGAPVVDDRTLTGIVGVAPSQTFTMTLEPRSDSQVLSGRFEVDVESSNAEFAVLHGDDPLIIEISVPADGTSAITVSALDLSARIDLEVLP